MKIKLELTAEPNSFANKDLWKVVETERFPFNKENEKIISASVLSGYLNNPETSMMFLEKIRERTEFKIGDCFSTIVSDKDLLEDVFFLSNIKVSKAGTCIEEEILSHEIFSLGNGGFKFCNTDTFLHAKFLAGAPLVILGTLNNLDGHDFFNTESLCVDDQFISKEHFPQMKEIIDSFIDNPFLLKILKDKTKEITINYPKIKNIPISIFFKVTELAAPPEPHLPPVPQKIIIHELFFGEGTGAFEKFSYLPEGYVYTNIIIDCDTGSLKFSFSELEDEEDGDCEGCEETSHVLDILCDMAQSDFFYLYKKTCNGSHVAYLASPEGDLIVATIPHLVDLDKDCELVRYKKKDISKIIELSLEMSGCKICLVTEEDSYSFNRDAFEEFILTYES